MEGQPQFENIETENQRTFTYMDNTNPEEPVVTKLKALNIPDADLEYEKLTGKKLDLGKGKVSRSFVYGDE